MFCPEPKVMSSSPDPLRKLDNKIRHIKTVEKKIRNARIKKKKLSKDHSLKVSPQLDILSSVISLRLVIPFDLDVFFRFGFFPELGPVGDLVSELVPVDLRFRRSRSGFGDLAKPSPIPLLFRVVP